MTLRLTYLCPLSPHVLMRKSSSRVLHSLPTFFVGRCHSVLAAGGGTWRSDVAETSMQN